MVMTDSKVGNARMNYVNDTIFPRRTGSRYAEQGVMSDAYSSRTSQLQLSPKGIIKIEAAKDGDVVGITFLFTLCIILSFESARTFLNYQSWPDVWTSCCSILVWLNQTGLPAGTS